MDENTQQLTLFPAPTKTYTKTFGWTVEQMKAGATVCRKHWSADGIHINVANPDIFASIGLAPFFIITYTPELKAVWHPTINDILAEDYDYA